MRHALALIPAVSTSPVRMNYLCAPDNGIAVVADVAVAACSALVLSGHCNDYQHDRDSGGSGHSLVHLEGTEPLRGCVFQRTELRQLLAGCLQCRQPQPRLCPPRQYKRPSAWVLRVHSPVRPARWCQPLAGASGGEPKPHTGRP